MSTHPVLVRRLTLVSILCVSLARAEPLPQPLSPALLAKNAASLMPTDGMRDHVFRDREAIGATLSIRSEHPGKPVLQVDVPRGSRSADAVELLWNTGKDIVQGDVGLLRLQVRTLKARQESGESEVKIMFQRNHTPWEKSLITQFSFGPDWTLIEIPFVADSSLVAGKGAVHLGFGALEQRVEITGVELLNFGRSATLQELPATRCTYAGREDNAKWRRQALQRIEQLRSAPIRLHLVDAAGQPLAIDPQAQLTINDYAMLNSSASPTVVSNFVDLIGRLRGLGAPIDLIGVQGHVGQQPRAPELVLKDLDLFLPTGLPVQITEFDINTKDEQLQADYTRDFLIAIYSHPAVNGYVQWGFYEQQHWKPQAAMYRKDWSEKPNLLVWRELVLKQWKTRFSGKTNSLGTLESRGHFGKYKLTVTADGRTSVYEFQHGKDGAPAHIVVQ